MSQDKPNGAKWLQLWKQGLINNEKADYKSESKYSRPANNRGFVKGNVNSLQKCNKHREGDREVGQQDKYVGAFLAFFEQKLHSVSYWSSSGRVWAHIWH